MRDEAHEACQLFRLELGRQRWLQVLPPERQPDEVEPHAGKGIDARRLGIGVIGPELARHGAELASGQVDTGVSRAARNGRGTVRRCTRCRRERTADERAPCHARLHRRPSSRARAVHGRHHPASERCVCKTPWMNHARPAVLMVRKA